MPLYIDIHHNLTGTTKEDLRKAHICDLEAQAKHGVSYIKYWFNESNGTVCCLVDAPSIEACHAVHDEAHGLCADEIIEVESSMIQQFLGDGKVDDVGAALLQDGNPQPSFRIILFTDLVGSTTMTAERGDEEAMVIIDKHDEIVRNSISLFGGREIKHTGDGIMASFISVLGAIQSAKTIQSGIKVWNEEHDKESFEVRIGLSAGEPVNKNKDLFGAAVQMASRVCDQTSAGEILVSNVVYELCLGKKINFTYRGETDLKGFVEPVRLHLVEQ